MLYFFKYERKKMKKNLLLSLLFLGTMSLLNGCTSTQANPNSGAQTGAVVGALAGSAIGYNSSSHNRGARAVGGGLLGAAVGAGVGNAVDNSNPPPQQTGGWQ